MAGAGIGQVTAFSGCLESAQQPPGQESKCLFPRQQLALGETKTIIRFHHSSHTRHRRCLRQPYVQRRIDRQSASLLLCAAHVVLFIKWSSAVNPTGELQRAAVVATAPVSSPSPRSRRHKVSCLDIRTDPVVGHDRLIATATFNQMLGISKRMTPLKDQIGAFAPPEYRHASTRGGKYVGLASIPSLCGGAHGIIASGRISRCVKWF